MSMSGLISSFKFTNFFKLAKFWSNSIWFKGSFHLVFVLLINR